MSSAEAPLLRVIRGGEPTAEELAALVAAITTATATAESEPPRRSRWNDRAGHLRRPLHPGPGAWVAAARR